MAILHEISHNIAIYKNREHRHNAAPFKTDSVFTLHIYYTILVIKSQRFFLKIENLKVLYHFFRKKINIYVQIAQEFFLLLSDRAAKYLLAEM